MKIKFRLLVSIATILLLSAFALGTGMMSGLAMNGLTAGRARELLRQSGGGMLGKDQVRILSVQSGITANEAIVEARIETAFRFIQGKDGWQVSEVRLGDRQWESFELVADAVRREKNRRTTEAMQQIAAVLETYRREQGSYVVAEEIVKVFDQLPPQAVHSLLRNDWWNQPFKYRGTATGYRLSSDGADRQPGTGDDLIIENGSLQAIQK